MAIRKKKTQPLWFPLLQKQQLLLEDFVMFLFNHDMLKDEPISKEKIVETYFNFVRDREIDMARRA